MSELEYEVSDESRRMLTSFKKVVDTILEEETNATVYLDLVIDKGIKAMLGDIIPKEVDVLWNTIERISEVYPEFLFEFVVEALERGEQINKASAKRKLGFIKNSSS